MKKNVEIEYVFIINIDCNQVTIFYIFVFIALLYLSFKITHFSSKLFILSYASLGRSKTYEENKNRGKTEIPKIKPIRPLYPILLVAIPVGSRILTEFMGCHPYAVRFGTN